MTDAAELADAIRMRDAARADAILARQPELGRAATAAGESMLLLALYHRADAIVTLLLRTGLRPNVWEAATLGQKARVQELIEGDDADVRGLSMDGWTALHLASHFGHAEVVAYLLEKGALVDARSTNVLANTALHAAVAGGHLRCAELLLEHGADPHATYLQGMTALHAAANAGNVHIARALLAHKSHPDARNEAGRTPEDLARQNGHEQVLRLLEAARSSP